jgi:hypothetical protein
MIGHQAISDEPEFEPLAVMLQAAKIKLQIYIVAEDSFSLVAAGDHVIQGARILNS